MRKILICGLAIVVLFTIATCTSFFKSSDSLFLLFGSVISGITFANLGGLLWINFQKKDLGVSANHLTRISVSLFLSNIFVSFIMIYYFTKYIVEVEIKKKDIVIMERHIRPLFVWNDELEQEINKIKQDNTTLRKELESIKR